jgi:probable HAF family extracellular repeat protein
MRVPRLATATTLLVLLSLAAASTRIGSSGAGAVGNGAPRYNIKELAPVSTQFRNQSIAYGVNALGQAVGESGSAQSGHDDHATLWAAGRPPLDLGTLGGPRSRAEAINTRGVVVGYSEIARPPGTRGAFHAFIWHRGGIRDLAPELDAQADGINDLGAIVGSAHVPRDAQYSAAYLILPRGRLTQLAPPASAALDVNEYGSSAGYVVPTGFDFNPHAAMWNGRRQIYLGTIVPGNFAAAASGINLFDHAVGYTIGDSTWNAFIRRNGRTLVIPNRSGTTATLAFAVNNADVVVGAAGAINMWRAWWWKNGQGSDLNTILPPTSGWTLEVANDINDLGQIVGYGTHNSVVRAWLLSPPPRTMVTNVYAVARRIRPRNAAYQRRVQRTFGALLRRRNLHSGCRLLADLRRYLKKNRRLDAAERITLDANLRGIAIQAARCGS